MPHDVYEDKVLYLLYAISIPRRKKAADEIRYVNSRCHLGRMRYAHPDGHGRRPGGTVVHLSQARRQPVPSQGPHASMYDPLVPFSFICPGFFFLSLSSCGCAPLSDGADLVRVEVETDILRCAETGAPNDCSPIPLFTRQTLTPRELGAGLVLFVPFAGMKMNIWPVLMEKKKAHS